MAGIVRAKIAGVEGGKVAQIILTIFRIDFVQEKIKTNTQNCGDRSCQNQTADNVLKQVIFDQFEVDLVIHKIGFSIHERRTNKERTRNNERNERRKTNVGRDKCQYFVELENHGQRYRQSRLKTPNRRQSDESAQSNGKCLGAVASVAFQNVFFDESFETFLPEINDEISRFDVG